MNCAGPQTGHVLIYVHVCAHARGPKPTRSVRETLSIPIYNLPIGCSGLRLRACEQIPVSQCCPPMPPVDALKGHEYGSYVHGSYVAPSGLPGKNAFTKWT